jgi:alanyl-tRNA synthetase
VTNRLYYAEPSCRRFDATITRAFDHEGRPAVTLDRTAFYPSSGGQPFDTGRLGATEVIDTIDEGDDIIHVLASPLAQGALVTGEIDWTRRFDHMQQHTGQHILSGAFEMLFENLTVGFHMGAEVSTIDLARDASSAEIERGVDESNRIVWEDRPVAIRFVSKAEAASLSLRKEPQREGTLRLIDISGFDLCACGGTHVDRTGAIGLIAVLGVERMRGGSRLTFVCGARALRALRTYRDAVAGSVRVLSVLPNELPAAIERIQDESRELRKHAKGLQDRLAEREGARLAAAAPEIEGVRLVVEAIDGWDLAGLKSLAAAATASARACVVLLTAAQPVSVVVACSPTVSIDSNAALQQLTHRFGGRGGGKPGLAQGGGLAAPAQEVASAARTLIESMLAG